MLAKKEEKQRKQRIRNINLYITPGTFKAIFKRFKGEKKDYDFSGITDLRKMLSNEKARILHVIKNKEPESIYTLARLLKRDFKSVRDDIRLLERFGFIEMRAEYKGKRRRLRPRVLVDKLNISINI